MDKYGIPLIEEDGATPVVEFTATDTGIADQPCPRWWRRNIEVRISGGSTRLLFSRSATVSIDAAAAAGDADFSELYTTGTYNFYLPQGVITLAARADTGATAVIRIRPLELPNQ